MLGFQLLGFFKDFLDFGLAVGLVALFFAGDFFFAFVELFLVVVFFAARAIRIPLP